MNNHRFTTSQQPIIFLSYANDVEQEHGYLSHLEHELSNVKRILTVPEATHNCQVFVASGNGKQWNKDFIQHRKRMKLFHFSGHGNSYSLLMQENGTRNVLLHKHKLEELLGNCASLELVFLNACKTLGHASTLLEVGVPAVVVTKNRVKDGLAREFSELFYKALISGETLQKAFLLACTLAHKSGSDKLMLEGYNLIQVFGGYRENGQTSLDTNRMLEWKGIYQHTREYDYLLCVREQGYLDWRLENVSYASHVHKKRFYSAYSPINRETFVGRKRELREMRQLLARTPLLIHGIGGMGKTTLAKYYIQAYKSRYDHIIWVDNLYTYETERSMMDSFVSGVNDIANHLDLTFVPQVTNEQKFRKIANELTKLSGENLLVIDNVCGSIKDIMRHLPKSGNWHILATSRIRSVGGGFHTYALEPLNKEEACELFGKYYSGQSLEDLLASLLSRFDYHTFTIELLAKTLKKYAKTRLNSLGEAILEKGLQAVGKLKVKIEHFSIDNRISINDCIVSLFDTKPLTDIEKQILTVFSVLPPNPVSYDKLDELLLVSAESKQQFLTRLEAIVESLKGINYEQEYYLRTQTLFLEGEILAFEEEEFIDTLSELVEKGWLNEYKGNYSCHQIIQEAVRQKLLSNVEDYQVLLLSLTVKLFIIQEKEEARSKLYWLPYAEQVLHWVDTNGGESLAELLDCVGLISYERGRYATAIALASRALGIAEELYGEASLKTGRFLNNLALSCAANRKYEEAKDRYEAAIEIAQTHLGDSHLVLGNRYSNVANVFNALGKYETAKEYFLKALSILIEHVGEQHYRVITVHCNLGGTMVYIGEYLEAQKHLEIAKEYFEKQDMEKKTRLAIVYHNLGIVSFKREQFEEALTKFDQAYQLYKDSLGKEHTWTQSTKAWRKKTYEQLSS